MSGRFAVVVGTRPEIIKLAGIVRLLGEDVEVIHSGQHYDANLSDTFFSSFGLQVPTVNVGVGGQSRGAQIGKTTTALDEHFAHRRPRAVIVQGDTNTTVAAALAANSQGVPLVHVEAGLRSYDRAMPEEHNRVIADHLSDLCLAPTETSLSNLVNEGIPEGQIVITGNTVVDAVRELLPNERSQEEILQRHQVGKAGYVLSTFHRPENVDEESGLRRIVDQLQSLELPVLLPLHPRTRARADQLGIDLETGSLRILDPLPYPEFLGLLAGAALAVSDSGGVQEEVSILKRPMLVVRRSTERPEVLDTFCTLLGPESEIAEQAGKLLESLPELLVELATIPSPYGDGTASVQSLEAIQAHFDLS